MKTGKSGFTILVADRNKYVCEFIKRELEKDENQVVVARTSVEILSHLSRKASIRLLILDPDLPGLDRMSIFKKSQKNTINIPIILHTHPSSDQSDAIARSTATITVEKTGNSIERIKRIITEIRLKDTSRKTPE